MIKMIEIGMSLILYPVTAALLIYIFAPLVKEIKRYWRLKKWEDFLCACGVMALAICVITGIVIYGLGKR